MKKIEIITRPDKLDIIKKILAQNEYSGVDTRPCNTGGTADE